MKEDFNNKILSAEYISLNVEAENRDEVFMYIVNRAFQCGCIANKKDVLDGLYEREFLGSTGMVDGFAIPHVQTDSIFFPCVFCVRLKHAVNWESMDDKPVIMILCLLIPNDKVNEIHLRILSSISKLLMKSDKRELLKKAEKTELIAILKSSVQ